MKQIRIFLIIFSLISGTVNLYAEPPDRFVFVVMIDGARYSETFGDSVAANIPRMKQLSLNGAIIDSFLNDGVTVTKRGIPAIWSGSWSVPVDTTIGGYSTQYATVPTIWEYYRKTFGAPVNDAVYFLKNLNGPWLPSYHSDYGPPYWPDYVLNGTNDLSVWNSSKIYLNTYHPRLVVLYLADVDSYGHSGNWNNYLKAIKTADSIVGMLWDFIQSDSIYKNKSVLLVTNDHGRHLDGVSAGFVSHGDGCWGCRHIQLLAVGPDIKSNYRYPFKRTIPDIMPTVGKILGFQAPYTSGTVMNELFVDDFRGENLNLDILIDGLYNPTTSLMNPDTIRVLLKNPTFPYSTADSASGIINEKGKARLSFNNAEDNRNYFLVFNHRNAVESWSRSVYAFKNKTLSFNIKSDSGRLYGDNITRKNSYWCIFNGDVNQDGIIDLTDLARVDKDYKQNATGYIESDLNGDGLTNAEDMKIVIQNSKSFISRKKPE